MVKVYSNLPYNVKFGTSKGYVTIRGKNSHVIETHLPQFTDVDDNQWGEIVALFAKTHPLFVSQQIWAEKNIVEAIAHARDAVQDVNGQEPVTDTTVKQQVKRVKQDAGTTTA